MPLLMTSKKQWRRNNMRTIKFRGIIIDYGEWVYGTLAFIKNLAFIDGDSVVGTGMYAIVPHSIGQFTGLTDKNGKDIYEGDILRSDKYPFNCDGVDNYYLVIEEVDSDGFLSLAPISRQATKSTCIGTNDGFERDWDSVKNAEVIGNIHDNVELLKDYKL